MIPLKKSTVKVENGESKTATPKKQEDQGQPELMSPEVIGRLNRLKKKLKKQKLMRKKMESSPVMSERLQARLLEKESKRTVTEIKVKRKADKNRSDKRTTNKPVNMSESDSKISAKVLDPIPVLSERLQAKLLEKETVPTSSAQEHANMSVKPEKHHKTETNMELKKNFIVRLIARPRKARVKYISNSSGILSVAGNDIVVLSSPEPWIPPVKVEKTSTPPKLDLEKSVDKGDSVADDNHGLLETPINKDEKCTIKEKKCETVRVEKKAKKKQKSSASVETIQLPVQSKNGGDRKSTADSAKRRVSSMCSDVKEKTLPKVTQASETHSKPEQPPTGHVSKTNIQRTEETLEPEAEIITTDKVIMDKARMRTGTPDGELMKCPTNEVTESTRVPVNASVNSSLSMDSKPNLDLIQANHKHDQASCTSPNEIISQSDSLSTSNLDSMKEETISIKNPSSVLESDRDTPAPAVEVEVCGDSEHSPTDDADSMQGVTISATAGVYHTKLQTVGHMYGLTSESPVRHPSGKTAKKSTISTSVSSVSTERISKEDKKKPRLSVPTNLIVKRDEQQPPKHPDLKSGAGNVDIEVSNTKPFMGPKSKKLKILDNTSVEYAELLDQDKKGVQDVESPIKPPPPVSPQSKICRVRLQPVSAKTVRRLMREQRLETPEQRTKRRKLKKALKKKKGMEIEASRLASKIRSKAIAESDSDSDSALTGKKSDTLAVKSSKIKSTPENSATSPFKKHKREKQNSVSETEEGTRTDKTSSTKGDKNKRRRHHSTSSIPACSEKTADVTNKHASTGARKSDSCDVRRRHSSAGSVQEIDMFASIRGMMEKQPDNSELKAKKKKHKDSKQNHLNSGNYNFTSASNMTWIR